MATLRQFHNGNCQASSGQEQSNRRASGSGSVLEEFPNRDLQAASKRLYGVERRVRLAALDSAHVRPGEAAPVRQGFLGYPRASPEGGDSLTELLSDVLTPRNLT